RREDRRVPLLGVTAPGRVARVLAHAVTRSVVGLDAGVGEPALDRLHGRIADRLATAFVPVAGGPAVDQDLLRFLLSGRFRSLRSRQSQDPCQSQQGKGGLGAPPLKACKSHALSPPSAPL